VTARFGRGQPRRRPGRAQSLSDVVPLRRLDRWQAETRREELADLYVESCDTQAGQEYHNREDFLSRLVVDVGRPGFDMLVAEGPALAGCAFGFPVGRDGSWWAGFDGALPEDLEQLTASGHVFAITEIVVHPHERDHDLGRRMLEVLLDDQHASLGVTKVGPADHADFVSFRSWGWREIGVVHDPAGPGDVRVLIHPLGERTARTPDGLAHDGHTQRPEGSA
jgi:GNAT superfamily N-acetyltransferase